MHKNDLQDRTKKFAIRTIRMARALPKSDESRIIFNQIVRSGTSVASNYRAACRSKPHADFISKIGTVEEEADESAFWMEIIIEIGLLPKGQVLDLLNEAYELVAIMVASKKISQKKFVVKFENRKS